MHNEIKDPDFRHRSFLVPHTHDNEAKIPSFDTELSTRSFSENKDYPGLLNKRPSSGAAVVISATSPTALPNPVPHRYTNNESNSPSFHTVNHLDTSMKTDSSRFRQGRRN